MPLSSLSSLGVSLLLLCSKTSGQTLVDIVVDTPDLSVLESALIQAGLAEPLSSTGPFTVFAPLDSAFTDLSTAAPTLADALFNDPGFELHLLDVLLYHVFADDAIFAADIPDGVNTLPMRNGDDLEVTKSGGTVTLAPANGGSATVVSPDVPASNGVAHVIDAVLLPEFVFNSIVDVAIGAAPEFTTLVDLVVLAGLADDLTNEFGMTVFAPTNDAFALLGANTLAYLTSPAGADALVETLLYHVIPQVIPSTAIPLGNTFVPTLLEGTQVLVVGYPRSVFVNRAKVIDTDGLANNGIIHAIDKVLLPPSLRTYGKGKGRNIYKGKGKGKGYWKGKGKGKGKGYWRSSKSKKSGKKSKKSWSRK